jgi:hypothetical protein
MNIKETAVKLKDYMITNWSTCKTATAVGFVAGLVVGWITT